ncbi:SseB family protein [Georgenia sp. Z1491]|uniref:SseB family protein n=1 Tax=Georgenia sp. Z1491 TaxID=3416707 RepID=UPI003CF5FFBB
MSEIVPGSGRRPTELSDSAGQAWAGRMLRANPFAGDDGSVTESMAAALAQTDPARRIVDVVAELRTGRVLVPVVAHDHPGREAGEVARHEKQISGDAQADAVASAASVTVATPDGRAALPAFSSYDAMRAWDPAARPVPVEGTRAAASATQTPDQILVLDPASDRPVLVGRPAVGAVAAGEDWVPPWEDEELPTAITSALRGSSDILGVRLEAGVRAELRVVLAVRPGFDRVGLEAELARVSTRLGELEELRHRVDSLELYPALVAE